MCMGPWSVSYSVSVVGQQLLLVYIYTVYGSISEYEYGPSAMCTGVYQNMSSFEAPCEDVNRTCFLSFLSSKYNR